MGKRKPMVTRRRIGAHFVDLTIQRSVLVDTSRTHSDAAEAEGSTAAPTPSVPWLPPSEPAPTATSSTAGVPLSPLPPLLVTTGSTSHSTDMHIQQGSPSRAATPHLHHVTKPTVAMVPPLVSAREESHAPQLTAVPATEESVTITFAQLETWKQRTILQIEDHFTNEQLKRIAEFGRVHANLVKEAKEYVAGIETQLKEQFERERESLKQQAEAYVSHFQQENEQLRQRVQALEDELEHMQEDQESDHEVLDDGVASQSVTTAIGFSPDAPSTSISDGAGSDIGGDAGMVSHSIEAPGARVPSENALRVDAVAEAMSRAMGIRTPRVTVPPAIPSPKEVLQLAPSPTTTNESSAVDTSDGQPPNGAPESRRPGTQVDTQVLAAEEDYL